MIIIPLFNIGKLLHNNISKFFIKVNNKFLIEYCLNSINTNNEKLLFILSDEDCVNLKIDKILKKIYKNCLIKIITNSISVLDSLYQSKNLINSYSDIIIYAPPFTYFEPKYNSNNIKDDISVLLIKTNNPIYCYAKIENNFITEIKEKKIISKYGLLGIYYFKNKSLLFKHISDVTLKKYKYLSDILNLCLKNSQINYKIIDLAYPFTSEKNINYIKKRILVNNKIFGLSSDHSGFKTKSLIIDYLNKNNLKYIDYGCFIEDDCDYQDFITNQYNGFLNNEFNFGISICRSGQGVNISANHTGFFSALIYDLWSVQMAIEHNNCNFLCLSERLIEKKKYSIEDIFDSIFKYKFMGGRFLDRLVKIE